MPMKLSKSLPLPKFSKWRILSSMCGECPAGSSRYFFGRDLHVWACALQRPDQEGHPVLTPGSSRQEQQVPPGPTVAVAEMFLLRRMPWPRQDQKPRPRQTPSDLPRQPSIRSGSIWGLVTLCHSIVVDLQFIRRKPSFPLTGFCSTTRPQKVPEIKRTHRQLMLCLAPP